MNGYTKLFGSIVASTIWREEKETKIVWITMLAMADRWGDVQASIPGLADLARVSVAEARKAIVVLSSPDPDSRTEDNEGRRIEAIDGGWRLINYEKYRAKMSAEDRREYLREKQREHRAKKRTLSTSVNNGQQKSTPSTHAEAEAEAEAETATVRSESDARAHNGPIMVDDPVEEDKGPFEEANRWLVEFGRSWCTRFSRIAYGNGAADARAVARLGEKLATLTREERDRAIQARPRILAAYWAAPDDGAKRAGHSFAFFVPRFDALLNAATSAEARAVVRRVCDFHALNPARKAPAGSASPLCATCDRLGAEPLAPWGAE